MAWFWSLKEPLQLALINILGLIGSGIVSAIIAYLGFRITLKTSTAANREIAEITKSAKFDELKRQSKLKLADYRMDWIESLRRDSAALYKVQFEISSLKAKRNRTSEEKEHLRELYFASAELKARILLRLKKDSDDESEKKLEQILRRAVSSDPEKAQESRKELRELTRSILKAEWNRVKAEIEA